MSTTPSLETPPLDTLSVSDFMALDFIPVQAGNLRRGGFSEVGRILSDGKAYFLKRQHNMTRRTFRHPRRHPTYFFEWKFIERLAGTGVTPHCVLYAEQRQGGNVDAVLITEELSGYRSLNEYHDAGEDMTSLMPALGRALHAIHARRIRHGSVHGEHILASPDGDVRLIDFERCRRHWSAVRCALADLKQLRKRSAWLGDSMMWQILSAYPDSMATRLATELNLPETSVS